MPDFYPFSQLLLDLLPNGEPWNKSPGSELEKTASKIGNIFHVIDFLLDSFPGELSPETCSQGQLIKFQKEMGVPLDTSAAGRDTAVRAYTSTGIISLSELKRELKDAAGIEPVIIEYMPSRAGQLRCG
ncbi:MAG TPA: hypothetical protein VE954_10430, partial [Oligoflexus sp.]|uniref:hypothetical protein n=1 Tax=Oligoflexus sp. TaxID=1971216 RepID=UPI002D5B4E16